MKSRPPYVIIRRKSQNLEKRARQNEKTHQPDSLRGSGAFPSADRLRKTEGTVRVSDDAGKDLEVRQDLSLYSGYDLRTREESYAWVDLDEVKLTKLDQDSRAEIEKEGKDLTIRVREGSLFFHVTESLAEDETLTIRVSTMAVGIRGTCG